MTIARELGNAVLHQNQAGLARARVDLGSRFVKPFEDVDHQAKAFASHYLIPEPAVPRAENAEALAEQYFVSLPAARIRFDQARERANRASVQAHLLARGDELRSNSLQ